MAGVDPFTRYLVLGGLGWVGWFWASAQPDGSWPRKMLDQARSVLKPTTAHAAPGTPTESPAPPPPAAAPGAAPPPADASAPVNLANTPVQQYNELEADGNWYQITQWSDGSFTSWLIPPTLWMAYGIPTGGAGGAVEGPPQEAGPCVAQKHTDGQWWLDCPFTDGSWSSTYIDPSQYVMFNILPDGSAINLAPVPGL